MYGIPWDSDDGCKSRAAGQLAMGAVAVECDGWCCAACIAHGSTLAAAFDFVLHDLSSVS